VADGVVLDTDVVSYLYRQDSHAERFAPLLADSFLIVSFMTVAELDRWAISRNWGTDRRAPRTVSR
jgi:tRNA(fMet)-specific endonuclease VapC